MSVNFNFHDVVGVRVETTDAFAESFFLAEYRPYVVETLPASVPRVTLQFSRGRMAAAPSAWIRHTHKALARWAYRIEIGEREVNIAAQGNNWSVPMVHHMMVHPSLRLLAARQGVLMLHAGAVAYNGRSLVFTGTGGAGKTTTVSLLLDRGGPAWALHADDYVFLTPEGESLSYLTRSHLYWPLLAWVPALKARLTAFEKARLRLLGAVRRWSGDRLKWPVRVEAARLWPAYFHQERAQLTAIMWLQRADGKEARLTPFEPSEVDLQSLLEINFKEARHFMALLELQGDISRKVILEWREQERQLLHAVMSRKPSYRLSIPQGRRDASFLPQLAALVGEHL